MFQRKDNPRQKFEELYLHYFGKRLSVDVLDSYKSIYEKDIDKIDGIFQEWHEEKSKGTKGDYIKGPMPYELSGLIKVEDGKKAMKAFGVSVCPRCNNSGEVAHYRVYLPGKDGYDWRYTKTPEKYDVTKIIVQIGFCACPVGIDLHRDKKSPVSRSVVEKLNKQGYAFPLEGVATRMKYANI